MPKANNDAGSDNVPKKLFSARVDGFMRHIRRVEVYTDKKFEAFYKKYHILIVRSEAGDCFYTVISYAKTMDEHISYQDDQSKNIKEAIKETFRRGKFFKYGYS